MGTKLVQSFDEGTQNIFNPNKNIFKGYYMWRTWRRIYCL